MKIFVLTLTLALALAQSAFGQASPREATSSQVTARSGSGYVSARRLPAGIGSVLDEGNSIDIRTNGSIYIPELSGRTNFWNVLNYGAAVYPANSTTAFNDAATNLTYAGGTLWFPRVIYGITGTVVIQGGLASGMPLAAYDYGNFTVAADKHARIYADVGLTNAFLFRTAAGQWRKSEVMNLSMNGTNTTHAIVPTLVGMAFDGPSGGLEVSRINIQQMGVGFVADDVTGATFRNLIGVNCGIGFAFGYKPDGIVVTDSTFRTNQWGIMTMFTNAQFTTLSAQEGNPSVKQTVFGQNQGGGVLHSHGTLELDGCYFESNGPDTNSNVAVQIGFDTSDAWQQSYTNNAPTASRPRLFWKNTGMNFKHSIKVYHPRGAEIYIETSKMEGTAIPVVRLMTSAADSSLVRCDMAEPLWVTNSSGTGLQIPYGWMFNSNAVVPISGMGSNFAHIVVTNLVSVPQAWTGTTNTLALTGGYQYYASANDVAVTNLSGMTAGEANWTTLRISNSAASAIVVRNTVGSTVRLQGTGSTNALTIPAAKVGFLSWLFSGDTNLWTTVQQ